MEKKNIPCPGCGVILYSSDTTLDKNLNALAACKKLYFALSYYTLSLHDNDFIHQVIVDAYTAQHAGEHTKPIAITFALIGLYLVNERNYTGKYVQRIHMQLAGRQKVWPHFSLPQEKTWLTVQDVLQVADKEKPARIKSWSQSVWNTYKPEEKKIATFLKEY